MVVTCQSQGSHALERILPYHGLAKKNIMVN